MPATDNQGSFLNRISIRRNQVVSMDNNHEQELEDLDLFQKHVADRFSDLLQQPPSPSSPSLSSPSLSSSPLLSIAWLRNLLDAFLCCEAEFKAVLVMGRDPAQFAKPPLDRLIPDLLDRGVKALDICNAVTHGLDLVRTWQSLAQIAVTALNQSPITEGHVKRAKKALTSLLTSMAYDDKENNSNNSNSNNHHGKSTERNCTVLVFVAWALVAAVPCQERAGLTAHFPVQKNLSWAGPVIGLQEKIGEEWKKKEKKGCCGLLEEVQRMERVSLSLVEFAESFKFPVGEEAAEEVAGMVAEMAEVCRRMEEGLVPLQLQVREVFHRIVRSRAEVLDVLEQVGKLNTPISY
ncbi:hypothetical protein RHMOL_Rhmol02G0294700 [Rhododendron molle]|uniref:Uncharacterized protein n=1 Tax=Rhododendron molle TaxID=49168 RepID=A0ACC0PYP3_RHOML|nr:hypothetical protein RHMOL_Rhmol02G0294700 [Rhododendron molle]